MRASVDESRGTLGLGARARTKKKQPDQASLSLEESEISVADDMNRKCIHAITQPNDMLTIAQAVRKRSM